MDTPELGYREADVAARFTLPPGLTFGNLQGLMPPAAATAGLDNAEGSALSSWFASQIDPSLTWRDVDWLRGAPARSLRGCAPRGFSPRARPLSPAPPTSLPRLPRRPQASRACPCF